MAGTAIPVDESLELSPSLRLSRSLRLSDFDFVLPAGRIAQHPLPERTASRLLRVGANELTDLHFADIERLLRPGDLLVFNDTRVVKARLLGRKPTGGRVEALIERVLEPRRALAMVRTSHTPATGTQFVFNDVAHATVEGRRDEFFVLRFERDVIEILEAHGHVPLPPYIGHGDTEFDLERYQTVYAQRPGAVAAPTAGLHFTTELLDRLHESGVRTANLTLHVGAGTFQPVRVERLSEHRMHAEWYDISPATAEAVNTARASGNRVIAVGTTSLRALESASDPAAGVKPGARETRLFITPGFEFRAVDCLITNFHLPKSTLLMLVSAFAGAERIRAAYAHAIEHEYRFFSYGDAMWLERAA